jgi:hypothetical protein
MQSNVRVMLLSDLVDPIKFRLVSGKETADQDGIVGVVLKKSVNARKVEKIEL